MMKIKFFKRILRQPIVLMLSCLCLAMTCDDWDEYYIQIHNGTQDTLYFAPAKELDRMYYTGDILLHLHKSSFLNGTFPEKLSPDSVFLEHDSRLKGEDIEIIDSEWLFILLVFNKDTLMRQMKDESQEYITKYDTIVYPYWQLRHNKFKIEYTDRSYNEQKRFK